MSKPYFLLAFAILFEVFATTCMKFSNGFTKTLPSALSILGYGVSFYCLSQTLNAIPTGIAYAVWSGVGIVLISLVSWLWFGQKLDGPAIAGLGLIIAGVVVVNVFSKSVSH